MSRPGENVMTVLPDKQRFPFNIKRKKVSETLIKGKESIQEPDNPSKREKEDGLLLSVVNYCEQGYILI